MDNTRILLPANLDFNDVPEMVWVRVQDAAKLLWNENPKLHSIGDLVTSIEKYGWQELPVFDKNLINIAGIEGAIKAGNGRIEALSQMESIKKPVPRGIAILKESGEWAMPLIVGVDAENIDMARAYAVDSNNLTASGGDLTALDMSKMWEPKAYMKLLRGLSDVDQEPVSVDKDTIEQLSKVIMDNDSAQERSGTDDQEKQLYLFVVVECDSERQQLDLEKRFTEEGLKCKSYSK